MAKPTLPPIKYPTLADLIRYGRRLLLECQKCGHKSELDPATIAARRGDQVTVEYIGRKAKCRRCGAGMPHITELWKPED